MRAAGRRAATEGRGAELPGRGLHVLRPDGAGHVGGGELQRRQTVRVQPHPHPVVQRPELRHVPHPLEPRQRVLEMDRGVVAQDSPSRVPPGEVRFTTISMFEDCLRVMIP